MSSSSIPRHIGPSGADERPDWRRRPTRGNMVHSLACSFWASLPLGHLYFDVVTDSTEHALVDRQA
jgi:hypothetical protein